MQNDLISRAAALAALGECPYNWNDWPEEIQAVDDWESHKEAIENTPAIDAVPVVRCKDCIHYNNNYCGDGFGWCERKGIGIGHGTSDYWFCASGEAKEES